MDFSQITNDLFIGTMPIATDYETLRDLGVRLVINMRFLRGPQPDLHPEALNFLWLRTIDSPIILVPVQKLIQGTKAALETIRNGGKVFTLRQGTSSQCGDGRSNFDCAGTYPRNCDTAYQKTTAHCRSWHVLYPQPDFSVRNALAKRIPKALNLRNSAFYFCSCRAAGYYPCQSRL